MAGPNTMSKVIAVMVFLAMTCMAQTDRHEHRLNPTPDSAALFKVYIPKDLDDCFVELERMLPSTLLDEMRESSERNMISQKSITARPLKERPRLHRSRPLP